ncbi:MAG TPA: DUF3368 domain-containing protein [Segetibacter sp.]
MATTLIDKIIISDTSCLIALEKINQLNILSQLFSVIWITKEIQIEFGKPLPEGFIIQKVEDDQRKKALEQIVDKGEASAIALALETNNALLIIDEKKGRKLAESLAIKIAGTLRILLLAKSRGLIPSVSHLLLQLEQHGFRFSKSIKEEVLKRSHEL